MTAPAAARPGGWARGVSEKGALAAVWAWLPAQVGLTVAVWLDCPCCCPLQVDPLVSLMKVEKVPDSTYDMIGGCDQQIKEIKEVTTGLCGHGAQGEKEGGGELACRQAHFMGNS